MTKPMDEPNKDAVPGAASQSEMPAAGRGLAFKVAAVVLTVVSALAGTGLARWLQKDGPPPGQTAQRPAGVAQPVPWKLPSRMRGWDSPAKPDLVLLLSAQQYGYMLPCGCSHPQVGGLERRYNFLQLLRAQGWPVLSVDLGDVAQVRAPPGPVRLTNLQALIKYRYSMFALKAMDYTAVSIGKNEAALPLFNALGEFALNEPKPRVVVANLQGAAEKFPGQTAEWQPATVPGSALRVGVTGLVSPKVATDIRATDPGVDFTASAPALQAVLKKMADAGIDLRVLLYQGPVDMATACAEHFRHFQVVLSLCHEDEPPLNPQIAEKSKSLIVRLGHKGKYVGVLGVYRTGNPSQPLQFRYELVEMSEDYLTPKERRADHPITRLMEDCTHELRGDLNKFPGGAYLARAAQTANKHGLQMLPPVPGLAKPGTPTYVGSRTCKKCHDSAYKVWTKTPHSHAYQTLVDDRWPSLRQYDPECVMCHVTGFNYEGGFTDAVKTPLLENVGCESCHGPGSVHAANPNDPVWQARMMNNNKWKAPEDETPQAKARRQGEIEKFCVECHNIDNDVTWKNDGKEDPFPRKWRKIAHPTTVQGE
jgi:hypothetical protein